MHVLPRHTARGIVLKDDQILLIERWRPGKHYFSIPGGGIELGESPEQAVLRELLEETACQVRLERKLYEYHTENDALHHIYLCEHVSGVPFLPPDSPEALANDPDNRFRPGWLPLAELDHTSFNVWRPVISRLCEDLRGGFADEVVRL